MENEEWRDIKGYEGLYQVSNYGRVKSLCSRNQKILKPCDCGNGYLIVSLHDKDKKVHTVKVHRLVAREFVENLNPDVLTDVNHKDENKLNNSADNLEWCNKTYNNNYGNHNNNVSETLGKSIRCIETGITYRSFRHAAKEMNLSNSNISLHMRNKMSSVKGYHFEYV